MNSSVKDKVSEFLTEYNLWDKTILVGFSGGFDSMCLLDILSDLNNSKPFKRLVACHYNHNWRGETARCEQENCRQFCDKRGIEFYTETAPDDVKKNETEARELRYAFFETAAEHYGGDIAVLTAHNFDDNAETVIYRLSKGTGIVGLRGILPVRSRYYRPLISVSREEIEQYCKDKNLNPNNDNSNEDRVHKRNLIRHDIIPLLEKINPDVKSALNNLCSVAITECEIIDEYIEKITADIIKDGVIDTQGFLNLSKPVRQKIIYNMIYESEYDYSMDTVLKICNFIETIVAENKPSKLSVGKDGWVYADSNIIEIIHSSDKPDEVVKITSEGEYRLGNVVFKISETNEYKKTGTEDTVCVDLTGFVDLYIRTRREGDLIQPLGCDGKMKLKKYLMSKKIPQHRRDELLLLTDGTEILWVGGVGISEKIKVKTKPTHVLSIER